MPSQSKVHRSLSDIHEWLLQCRSLRDGPEDDNGVSEPVDLVVVTGDPQDDEDEVMIIQNEVNTMLDLLNELDCTFHDHFDCR